MRALAQVDDTGVPVGTHHSHVLLHTKRAQDFERERPCERPSRTCALNSADRLGVLLHDEASGIHRGAGASTRPVTAGRSPADSGSIGDTLEMPFV